MIDPRRNSMTVCIALMSLIAPGALAQVDDNYSIDPAWMWISEPASAEAITVTEPVPGSDIPVQLMFVELRDGVYAPIGLRKPVGAGRGKEGGGGGGEGCLGLGWIREWTRNGSWTLEQFLAAGYAVVWMRYRAEVDSSYGVCQQSCRIH